MSIPRVNLQLATPITKISVEKAFAILNQFNGADIKAKLLAFPEQVKSQKLIVNQFWQALKDTELASKEAEALLVTEIAAELNDNGKAKYSNAEARAAELLSRKRTSPEYSFAENDRRRAEGKLEEAQAELEYLYDGYKAYRYIARLTAEELAVINNLSENEEV